MNNIAFSCWCTIVPTKKTHVSVFQNVKQAPTNVHLHNSVSGLFVKNSQSKLDMKKFVIGFILLAAVSQSCAPYQYGPFMKQNQIRQVFPPILKFMDYKAGMTFADVGAASGALTVMMATLMDSSAVYIQDIDTAHLQSNNVEKIIDYYSRQCKTDLRRKNTFQVVIGDKEHSNLPEQSVDLIYTNATFHTLDFPDAMLTDLHRKLKPDGRIFIRDGFRNFGGGSYCTDKKCGKHLVTVDEFLAMMKKNGFELVKQSPNMDGYPLFGFKRSIN